MGEARGCAVHPAGDGSRDQCGDVTDRDGQILGIGSRKQAAASGRASPLSHVLSPCVPVFRVRTPHLACRSLLGSRGTWGDETRNLFWRRIAASWIPFIERLPEVHAAFLVCGCDGWKAGGCPLRNWVTQSQGCICGTDWRSQGCHGLTWDSLRFFQALATPFTSMGGAWKVCRLALGCNQPWVCKGVYFSALLCKSPVMLGTEFGGGMLVKNYGQNQEWGLGSEKGGNCRKNDFLKYWWHVQSVNSLPPQTVLFCCHPKPSQGHWRRVN